MSRVITRFIRRHYYWWVIDACEVACSRGLVRGEWGWIVFAIMVDFSSIVEDFRAISTHFHSAKWAS